ncbi:MAG: alpha/beta hydrolase [Lachnospiraceae bacterium]|nr:alpha/beta hydrolase [Lachnospiraceae bacterium]
MSDQGQSSEQAAKNIFSLNVDGYTAQCFLPVDGTIDKIVYMHAAMPDEADKVWQLLSCKCALICIGGIDWNRDMSPWYHPKVFAQGEDFAGGADAYLKDLCNRIIPEIEQKLNSDIIIEFSEKTARYLAGYSLGGLFALYALYHTDLFDGVASMSGSLWYDGWIPYIKAHEMCRKPEKIYFSLGDKEAGGNARMRTVEEHTAQTEQLVREMEIMTVFEHNPGNHFKDVPLRIARGIDWLIWD